MNIPLPIKVPPLHTGDRLKQPEFHRRYLAHPGSEKFELIGGIVYMASPVSWRHSELHAEVGGLFRLYKAATPGVRLGTDGTTILGEESEPQPDQTLRIDSKFGGRSLVNEAGYVEG